jgi:predicted transcriptional regulator
MVLTLGQRAVLTTLLQEYGFRELSKLSGIPKTTLYYMNVGLDRKYYVDTIEKLADMGGMLVSEFLALR